jgi:hypothetical protein
LESIGALKEYVTASTVVLIMLGSHRYFVSANCIIEMDAARLENKPLCLVHESDSDKNGAPLSELTDACPEELRGFIFNGRPVVPWHRVHAFQCVSLIAIAEKIIMQLPAYLGRNRLELMLPADLRDQALEFGSRVRLYASPFNPGADRVALDLVACATRVRTRTESEGRNHGHRKSRGSSVEGWNAVEWTNVAPENVGTDAKGFVFLLYLTAQTFSRNGDLSREVLRALSLGAKFCLIHEIEVEAGGATFASIIEHAGPELLAAGLFAPLATAWHPGDYRAVSIKLALMSLGATAARPEGVLRGFIRRRSRTRPQNELNEQLMLASAAGPSSSQAVVTDGSGVELARAETCSASPVVRFYIGSSKSV